MRRILITKWVGADWETLTTDKLNEDFYAMLFQTTSAPLTVDGTHDDVICPTKGHSYAIPELTPIHADDDVIYHAQVEKVLKRA